MFLYKYYNWLFHQGPNLKLLLIKIFYHTSQYFLSNGHLYILHEKKKRLFLPNGLSFLYFFLSFLRVTSFITVFIFLRQINWKLNFISSQHLCKNQSGTFTEVHVKYPLHINLDAIFICKKYREEAKLNLASLILMLRANNIWLQICAIALDTYIRS